MHKIVLIAPQRADGHKYVGTGLAWRVGRLFGGDTDG